MWVARDRNGDLRLFSLHKYKKEYQKPPIRDNQYGIWCVPGQTLNSMIDVMSIDPSLFPNLKWEDEPIEVRLEKVNLDQELMPVEREIIKGSNSLDLYECKKTVKRYTFSNQREYSEFLTIEQFTQGDFYSDDGEWEAYLSDGKEFIGTNLYNVDNLEEFIDTHKGLLKGQDNLCIYYIDYPEDK